MSAEFFYIREAVLHLEVDSILWALQMQFMGAEACLCGQMEKQMSNGKSTSEIKLTRLERLALEFSLKKKWAASEARTHKDSDRMRNFFRGFESACDEFMRAIDRVKKDKK